MGEGERLKVRRETLGRSIEDVSVALRISEKYLRGIESGNYDGFPARVFSVGFIKSYAAFLGEDPEPLIREFTAQSGDSPMAESDVTVAVSSQWVQTERKRGNRMLLYILAAIVVLAIGIVLSLFTPRPVDTPVLPIPKAGPPPENVASGMVKTDNAATPAPVAADNAAPPEVVPQPVPATAPQDNIVVGGEVASIPPPYQLFIQATDQSWLMYSTDDGEPVDTMLYPGDKLSVHAVRKIFLKLGNAGGVTATLNGRRIPAFGSRGQVRVVTLGK
jgi:cytoskeleton protein RodZ